MVVSDRSRRQEQDSTEVIHMAMKLVPLHDRILVRRVEEEETTRGGIVIPDTAKDKPQEGEVIAAGKGKVNEKSKLFPPRQGGRSCPFRKVCRDRDQDRRRRIPNHTGGRSAWHPDRNEES